MSPLPGDRLPDPSGSVPAAAADLPPVWDRFGAQWVWSPDEGGYVCQDDTYRGPVVVEPGAIPTDRQPFFAHPPNAAQRAGMELHPEER